MMCISRARARVSVSVLVVLLKHGILQRNVRLDVEINAPLLRHERESRFASSAEPIFRPVRELATACVPACVLPRAEPA